jgi:hypothetical protein
MKKTLMFQSPTTGFWKSDRRMNNMATDMLDAMALYREARQLPLGFPCPLFGMPLLGLTEGARELGVSQNAIDLIAAPARLQLIALKLKLLAIQRDSLLTLKGIQ